jgi:cupin superfamily acireductone dioxygenase involved in methionine salvage
VVDTEGYVLVDALHMTPADTDEWTEHAAQARQKFLAEHTHDDDEDRFFARGAGVFYLHVDGKAYGVLCEAGDLLSIPENTTPRSRLPGLRHPHRVPLPRDTFGRGKYVDRDFRVGMSVRVMCG